MSGLELFEVRDVGLRKFLGRYNRCSDGLRRGAIPQHGIVRKAQLRILDVLHDALVCFIEGSVLNLIALDVEGDVVIPMVLEELINL